MTICESGARAGIAASILAAQGVDARPVLDGGLTAWAARGGAMVEFRRCGVVSLRPELAQSRLTRRAFVVRSRHRLS